MSSPMVRASVWLFILLGTGFVLLWTQPWDEEEAGQAPAAKRQAPVKFDAALAKRGAQVSASNGCGSCHSTDGSKTVGPTWKGTYGVPVELGGGKSVRLDEKFIETAIVDPPAQVRKGFSPSMPSYRDKLSPADVKALAELMKSLAQE